MNRHKFDYIGFLHVSPSNCTVSFFIYNQIGSLHSFLVHLLNSRRCCYLCRTYFISRGIFIRSLILFHSTERMSFIKCSCSRFFIYFTHSTDLVSKLHHGKTIKIPFFLCVEALIKIDVQMRLSACLFNELLLYSDAYHSGRRKKLTNKRLNKPNQNKTKKNPMNSKQSDVFQIESIDLVSSCYRIVK